MVQASASNSDRTDLASGLEQDAGGAVRLVRPLRQGGERGANDPHLPFQILLAELLQPPRRPGQAGFREILVNAVGGAGPEMRGTGSGREERDVPVVERPALGGNGWRQIGVCSTASHRRSKRRSRSRASRSRSG